MQKLAFWMVIGGAVGVAVGVATHNVAVWTGAGFAIGCLTGTPLRPRAGK